MEAADVDRSLIRLGPKAPLDGFAGLADIELAVRNGGDGAPRLTGVRLVTKESEAELIWDRRQERIYNASGDLLASGIDERNLQAAVDARRVRAALVEVMKRGDGLAVRLLPDDRLYSRGCQVEYRVDAFEQPHFTVLNMASNGTIQFLFPLERYRDPVRWDRPGGWTVKTRVTPPFGADYLIFIASEKPLPDLHRSLGALNRTPAPLALHEALSKWLPRSGFQLGLKGAFTSEEGQPCN